MGERKSDSDVGKQDPVAGWPWEKKTCFAVISAGIALVVVELLAYFVLAAAGYIRANPRYAFHPIFRHHEPPPNSWADSRYRFDPFLAYRYRPGQTYGNLAIDEHGFIHNGTGPVDLFEKPEGTLRIFLLGGSTVAGCGASDNAHTIAAQMERMLNRRSDARRYEVVNAGVDGYYAFNETGYFLSRLWRYQPDIVIFYDGWNDYAYPVWAGGYLSASDRRYHASNSHEYALYLQQVLAKQTGRTAQILDIPLLLDRMYSAVLLRKILFRAFPDLRPAATNKEMLDRRRLHLSPREAAELYLSFMKSAVGAAAAHDLSVFYLLQPTILDKKTLTHEEKRLFDSRQALAGAMSRPETIGEYYGAVRNRMPAIADRFKDDPRVCIRDLSRDMWNDVQARVYIDEVHTNDEGNRIIAGRLTELVLASIRKGTDGSGKGGS